MSSKGRKEEKRTRPYVLRVPKIVGGDYVYEFSPTDTVIIPWNAKSPHEWTEEKIVNNLRIGGEVSTEEIDKTVYNFFKPESIEFRNKREGMSGMTSLAGSLSWNPLKVLMVNRTQEGYTLVLSNDRHIKLTLEEYTRIKGLEEFKNGSVPLQVEEVLLFLDFSTVNKECVS